MNLFQQIFLLLIIVLLAVNVLTAQWVQTDGPHTEVTYSLAVGINHTGDSILYAGTYHGGVFLSTNYGDNWLEIDGGNFSTGDTGFTSRDIHTLLANNDGKGGISLYAGNGYAVFLSTNNGANWTPVDSLVGYRDFVMTYNSTSDTNLFRINDNRKGVLRSTDNGATWFATSSNWPDQTNITCLAAHDTIVYAGTSGYGVYYSLTSGKHWVPGGYPSPTALAVAGPYLFAGSGGVGSNASVWRRSLSEMVTVGVPARNEHNTIEFVLEQNYPNPFNPSTSISFNLPAKSYVSLKVYDMMGADITTLLSEVLPEGNHSIQWNAAHFSSGIYFCRLQAGTFSQTKKLVLLK